MRMYIRFIGSGTVLINMDVKIAAIVLLSPIARKLTVAFEIGFLFFLLIAHHFLS